MGIFSEVDDGRQVMVERRWSSRARDHHTSLQFTISQDHQNLPTKYSLHHVCSKSYEPRTWTYVHIPFEVDRQGSYGEVVMEFPVCKNTLVFFTRLAHLGVGCMTIASS